MLIWGISVREIPSGSYEVCVRFPGSPSDGYTFERKLPPDFSDFLAALPPTTATRKWRRAPQEVGQDDLLFCAANLDTVKDIGTRLYEALFYDGTPGAERPFTDAFLALRASAAADKGGLAVEIDLSRAPTLARVPWEALYLPANDLFLGIDTTTNLVRRLSPDRAARLPDPIEPPIRLLVVVANPTGDIDSDVEVANIEARLSGLLARASDPYEVRTLPAATRSQLADRIEDWKPHIIHFIGHGGFYDEKGLIYLHAERETNQRDPIDSATLRDLVRNDRPWLVVMNSCLGGAAAKADPFGGAAHNLIRANIPFVVAMQSYVSDDAAVRFSQRFYASLIRDTRVATAVTRGRNAIRSLADEAAQAELITPVLYSSGETSTIAIQRTGPGPDGGAIPPLAPPTPGTGATRLERALQAFAALATIGGLWFVVQTGQQESEKVAEQPSPSTVVPLDAGGAGTGAGSAVGEARQARRAPMPLRTLPRPSQERVPTRTAHSASQGTPPVFDRLLEAADPDEAEPRTRICCGGPFEQDLPPVAAGPSPRRAIPEREAGVAGPYAALGPAPHLRDRDRRGVIGARRSSPSLFQPRIFGVDPESLLPPGFGDPPIATQGPRGFANERAASASPPAAAGPTMDRFSLRSLTAARPGGAPPPHILYALGTAAIFDLYEVRPAASAATIFADIVTGLAEDDLSLLLIAHSDRREGGPFALPLALERTRIVAGDIEAAGVPRDRIRVAASMAFESRSPVRSAASRFESRVDARLLVRGAQHVLFEPGSAELAPTSLGTVARFSEWLRENPRFAGRIESVSYGAAGAEDELASRRAEAVVSELRRLGVAEESIVPLTDAEPLPGTTGDVTLSREMVLLSAIRTHQDQAAEPLAPVVDAQESPSDPER